MNNIVRDRIRENKDRVRTLDLKKETLLEKIQMQKNFIDELETRSNDNIDANKEKITKLNTEVDLYLVDNETLGNELNKVRSEMEKTTNPQSTIKKMNNIM